jgi:hypothetical protein
LHRDKGESAGRRQQRFKGELEMQIRNVAIIRIAMLAAGSMARAGLPGVGTITGEVPYEETPARRKLIDMSMNPACANM